MQIIFLFLLFVSSAFSIDPPYLLALTESDPSAMVDGKVNVITGDLYLVESDLQVQGYEPISIIRSYMSHERGDWKFTPHVNALVEKRGNFWIVTEKYGAPIVYYETGKAKIHGKKFYRYEPLNLEKGFSNTSQGRISSETNLKNNFFLFDEKHKEFTLFSSDGSERRYHKNYKGDGQFRLLFEKLPNGKQIVYEYQETKDKYLGNIYNLSSIATKNVSGSQTFAKVNFQYEDSKRKNKHFFVRGSNGESIEYQFRARRRDGGCTSGELESVVSTVGPNLHLKTIKHHESKDWSFRSGERVLTTLSSANKKTFGVEYYLRSVEHVRGERVLMQDPRTPISENEAFVTADLRRGKVKTLLAPLGPNASIVATHSFFYDFEARKTTVYDISDCRTEYFWNENLRLQKIDRYDPSGHLHSGEEFQWKEGNLEKKSFFDQKRNILFSRELTYDNLGNVTEEKLIGNLTGEGSTEKAIRRASYAGKSPYRQQEPQGLVVLYEYVPGTNLIKTKKLCDNYAVTVCYFYEYDADLVLTKEVIDDGISKKIRCITPRKHEPYYGMPEIVEEKYEDEGREILLQKTVFHYGKGGKITQKDIYDAEGIFRYSLKMGYDEKGRLILETNPLGWQSTAQYDEAGNKIFSSDYAGNTAHSIYDAANRLIEKKETGFDGVERRFIYTYDHKNNLISETDGHGNPTKYVKNPFGEIVQIHLPPAFDHETSTFVSAIIRSEFDSAGNEIQHMDPQGFKKEIFYNARKEPTLIQHPGGGREKFVYYLHGSIKKHIDPAGLVTEYSRDHLDRAVRKTFTYEGKCLRTETFDYTGLLLTSKTDPEGHRTFYVYDKAGRKIAEECEGEKTFFHYDPLSRMDKIETECLQTLFQYDLLDRVQERKEIDAQTNELLRTVTYQYDRANNITAIHKIVDGQETEETFGYDSQNRLIWHVFPTGFKETFVYNDTYVNEYGQKVLQKTHTDPNALETIETHDALGRIVKLEQRKEGKILSEVKKQYNRRGDLCLQIDTVFSPNGLSRQIRTKWDYNADGRLAKLTEAEGTLDEKITTYTYTLRGDKETVTKPDGTVLNYLVNPFGEVIKLSSSDKSVCHEMRYDKKGNLIWNDQIEKSWDAKGRLLSEAFFSKLRYEIFNTYNLSGQRTDFKIPLADCWIQYKHNGLDLTEIVRQNMLGKESFYKFELSHDLSGNLQEMQLPTGFGQIKIHYDKAARKVGLETPSFWQEVLQIDRLGNILALRTLGDLSQFVYDDLYQLASEKGLFNHDYTHDSLYCRIQKNNEPYQVNELSQLISHFEYDKNGNPKSQGDIFYTCDALDRLVRLETPDAIYSYTYDAMHRKISSIKESKNGMDREVSYPIYDGQNEIGSFDDQGNLKEFRVLGPTPHAEIGATLAVELNGKTYLSISDLFGNIAALLPLEGGPLELTRYSAFGEETGSATSPWRFASKRVEETGLINFGRRYYAASLGRWLTPDPLGFHDGMNLYAYVHNNPINHFDEYGLLDYGQYDKNWHKHSDRCQKSIVHELSTQALDIAHFFASTPYYLESGVNYVTGRQKSWTENWHRCHSRFFNSETNWVYQSFPTEMTHPTYLNMRNEVAWGSFVISGYRLAKGAAIGAVRAASWGINKFRKPSPQVFIPSRPATSVVSAHLLKNKLIAQQIAGGHPLLKKLKDNRDGYWHQETGTVVIHDPTAIDRGTAFQPRRGVKYFDEKLK